MCICVHECVESVVLRVTCQWPPNYANYFSRFKNLDLALILNLSQSRSFNNSIRFKGFISSFFCFSVQKYASVNNQ